MKPISILVPARGRILAAAAVSMLLVSQAQAQRWCSNATALCSAPDVTILAPLTLQKVTSPLTLRWAGNGSTCFNVRVMDPARGFKWVFGPNVTNATSMVISLPPGKYMAGIGSENQCLGAGDATRRFEVVTGCPWNLTELSGPAAEFEQFNGSAPPTSLYPPYVETSLSNLVDKLATTAAAEGITLTRASGFRPSEYQAHFYEIKQAYEALFRAKQTDPNIEALCGKLDSILTAEIGRHRLKPMKKPGTDEIIVGTLAVSPAGRSNHESLPSKALDVSIAPASRTSRVEQLIRPIGLAKPCSEAAFHVQEIGTSCAGRTAVTAAAFSPVYILLTDPKGRRVGYDPKTKDIVQEIESATYSGPDADPQQIDITDPIPGDYVLGAVGTSGGTYTVLLREVDVSDGSVLSEQIANGVAVLNSPISRVTLRATAPNAAGPRRRAVSR